jgi:hypothetical protein
MNWSVRYADVFAEANKALNLHNMSEEQSIQYIVTKTGCSETIAQSAFDAVVDTWMYGLGM